MTLKNILNFILFQLLWLACVWGAANALIWPGIVVLSLLIIWHAIPANQHRGDVRLVILCLLLGGLVDSLWQISDLLQFKLPLASTVAPLWILMLWMGVALTLNHSLSWLKNRYAIAALFAGIAAPCSYYAAQRIGAVQINSEQTVFAFAILAIAWAVIFPFLIYCAQRWTSQHDALIEVKV